MKEETQFELNAAGNGFLLGLLEFGTLGVILGWLTGNGLWDHGLKFGSLVGGVCFAALGYSTARHAVKTFSKQKQLSAGNLIARVIILSSLGAYIAYELLSALKLYAADQGIEWDPVNYVNTWSVCMIG